MIDILHLTAVSQLGSNGNLLDSIVLTVVTPNVTPKQPETPLQADPNVTLISSVVTSRPNDVTLA
ncbi:MAG: hypothetical protein IVW52_19905 [Acidimicrobiales bacterium]|nr:hypothetical protein [Acidimicrobiales bacterium]